MGLWSTVSIPLVSQLMSFISKYMRTPWKETLNWKTWTDICSVTEQDPFCTGSCFHFYNHLSCHHRAVLQYADKLPTLAKKTSQEKQDRKKRRKTSLDCINKYHLICKMAEQQDCLTSIIILTEQLPGGLMATSVHRQPILTQLEKSPGLI
jgi:hypothetical protein